MSTGGTGLVMMPWYPRDFRSSTLTWPFIARAVYRELLDIQWDAGALPSDPSDLRELVRASETEWAKAWSRCESKFPIGADGLRRNSRLEAHRADSLVRREKARAKASKAGRAKASKTGRGHSSEGLADTSCMPQEVLEALPQAVPEAMLEQCPPSPSPSPSPESEVSFGNSRARLRAQRVTVPAFHQVVIDAYHRILPDLPRVKAWSKSRRQALNARIGERVADGKPANTIDYWNGFFETVAASDFLTGKVKDFRADLEWLLRPENFLKVIEDKYTPRARADQDRRHAV